MQNAEKAPDKTKKRLRSRRISRSWLWAIPFILVISLAIYFYIQWQQAQIKAAEMASDQIEKQEEDQVQEVIAELATLVLLPEGETPVLSTITNKDDLTDNKEFFENAQDGDQVIVYQQARKVYLYRPSKNILINLAPINVADANNQQGLEPNSPDESNNTLETSTPPIAESSTSIELRNGTSSQRVMFAVEDKLLDEFKQTIVSTREVAIRNNHPETLVIPVDLTKTILAQQIATALSATVTNLPDDESQSEADLLIIVGTDQI